MTFFPSSATIALFVTTTKSPANHFMNRIMLAFLHFTVHPTTSQSGYTIFTIRMASALYWSMLEKKTTRVWLTCQVFRVDFLMYIWSISLPSLFIRASNNSNNQSIIHQFSIHIHIWWPKYCWIVEVIVAVFIIFAFVSRRLFLYLYHHYLHCEHLSRYLTLVTT